ncbi:RDD family protein [Pseudoxanthomonas sp. PXM01]|uniref:RDD family protein n=1 Tax=Pseudoxanthomonas sp. PXM01 TaxID=2769295 RepID=UPI00177B9B80|nr:RDD family protein [Pseudoxanthomonas sp. PXM01]MBD9469193.1 RDD family protein [Pseudoxanthomonas sp. PXM01]
MTQWYYVDAQQQRHGPVDPRMVGDLFRDGTLGRNSLVWREGMQEWTALINVAPELRLDMTPPPPPVPEATEAPAAAALEAERPLTGRAVFTASEPVYVAPAASARAEQGSAATGSPYAAPRADFGTRAYAAAVPAAHVVYAGFWKRVAASFIDAFAIGLPVGILAAIIAGLLGFGSSFSSGFASDAINLGETGISYVLTSMTYAWFHSAAGLMATPGKLAIGIKVVRTDGDKISFLRGFGRYWAAFLSFIILCIGFLMAAFTARKQTLHDMICDTLVVDKWAFTSQPERQREELGTVALVVLIIGGLLIGGTLILMLVAFGTLLSMAR